MGSLEGSIKISKRLKEFLDKSSTHKGQTYDDIIWRLLGQKELTKEQKQEVKADFENSL